MGRAGSLKGNPRRKQFHQGQGQNRQNGNTGTTGLLGTGAVTATTVIAMIAIRGDRCRTTRHRVGIAGGSGGFHRHVMGALPVDAVTHAARGERRLRR